MEAAQKLAAMRAVKVRAGPENFLRGEESGKRGSAKASWARVHGRAKGAGRRGAAGGGRFGQVTAHGVDAAGGAVADDEFTADGADGGIGKAGAEGGGCTGMGELAEVHTAGKRDGD